LLFGRDFSGACNKAFGGHSKYHLVPTLEHEQQHLAIWGNPCRVLDFDSDRNIHGYYDSESPVRRGLLTPFFVRPKLKVEILSRGKPPHDIASGIEREVAFDLGLGSAPEIIMQSLALTAKNYGVPRLGAMMWLDGVGPYHMRWKMPQTVPETFKIGDSQFTRGRYVESPRHIRIVKDEKIFLCVWFAYRRREVEKFTLNTEPLLTHNFGEFGRDSVDMEIQFAPIDKKPRKYQLCVKSWNELDLTERN
jgi:hypothetical protein